MPTKLHLKLRDENGNIKKQEILQALHELILNMHFIKFILGWNVIELEMDMKILSEIGKEFENILMKNKLSMTVLIYDEPKKTRFILPLVETEEPCVEVTSYLSLNNPEYYCLYLQGDVNLVA